MGTKFFSDELPLHKLAVDTWIASLIQAKLGVSEWIAPLGADGKVPSQYISIPPLVWGNISGTLSDQTDLLNALGAKASTSSPAFSGVPTAPTAVAGTNTLQLATTAFTKQAFENTGLIWTPNAPIQAQGDNSTKVANTSYVDTAITGVIIPNLIETITTTQLVSAIDIDIPIGYKDILIQTRNVRVSGTGNVIRCYVSTDGFTTTQGGYKYQYTKTGSTTITAGTSTSFTTLGFSGYPVIDDSKMRVLIKDYETNKDTPIVFSFVNGKESRDGIFVMYNTARLDTFRFTISGTDTFDIGLVIDVIGIPYEE